MVREAQRVKGRLIAEPGATEFILSYKDGVLINKEQIKMEPIISSHELTKEKLPAIAEEFSSGTWIEGASRFFNCLIIQTEEAEQPK
jgi:hypothetical protein